MIATMDILIKLISTKLAPAVTYWQVEYKFTHLLFRPIQVSTFTHKKKKNSHTHPCVKQTHTFMYNLIYRDTVSVIVEEKCWSFKWVQSSRCAVGFIKRYGQQRYS